jgi:DNA-binding NarL/FixJ family response regulator
LTCVAEVILTSDPTDRATALNELDLAIGELQAMHMGPALQRAFALRTKMARSASATGATADIFSGDLLTPREHEVAALLAHGLSNREIGEALGISTSTVEVHVKHVLGKLGFTSRSQLAAKAAQSVRSDTHS